MHHSVTFNVTYLTFFAQLQIAAGEQDKITKLRLMKILHAFEEKTESIQYSLSKL